METTKQNIKDTDIAIIGMAGKFPGADNLDQFWDNLKQGVISIKRFSDEDLIENEVNKQDLQHPNYIRAKGTLSDIEYFDGEFFDYTGREAEILDPQIRLLTELSWHALEDAGYVPEKYNGNIGVYTGVTNNLYWQLKMIASGKITNNETLSVAIYSEKDHVSTRISYKLNLTGPSFTVETQCSTSLVAFHLACQGIINGECDMAIAGGASINLPNKAGYIYQEGSIHSKDGVCRAFDENANGTVFSDGAGLVVVKNARKAIADGDNIYAIVKGSAVNNDGLEKAGFTAPSVSGQKKVITHAYEKAGVNPETITYIETHGTGTAIGDPIEIEALTRAFNTNKRGYCRIGSLKPNVGHMDNAAGIGNVIKATLAIKNKQIPPSVNYNKPNPKIKFEETPFVVNTQLVDWEENQSYPRRAGVSSYGVGGTNAHVLLEEYISQDQVEVNNDGLYLIPFSAKSEYSFNALKANLQRYLEGYPGSLSDIAYTLQTGRRDLSYRHVILGNSEDEVLKKLKVATPSSAKKTEDIRTIFLFPGQGAQYVNMGRGLYEQCKPFRRALDQCFEIYAQITNEDLREIVFGDLREEGSTINETKNVQPLIFSFEFALARVLMEAGIKPDYMIGHSIGEYTAACISGVLSLQDAMKLVIKRGELIQSLPKGSMMAIMMEPEDLKPILSRDISIAAINSTGITVVSGEDKAIDELDTTLKRQGVEGRKLHTSHAFHSHMMDPAIDKFEQMFKEVDINEPQIGYMSNLTGKPIQGEEIKKPSYWSAHLRNTVLFKDNIENLPDKGNSIFIEVGPGNVLSSFVKRFSSESRNYAIYNTIRHPQEKVSDTEVFYNVLGKIWQKGLAVNWNKVFDNSARRKVSVPVYPFERKKHWVKGNVYQIAQGAADGTVKYKDSEMLYNRRLYRPTWVETALEPQTLDTNSKSWIVFAEDGDLVSQHILTQTKELSKYALIVNNGDEYKRLKNGYVINHENKHDYKQLFNELKAGINDKEINILHFWSLNFDSELDIHSSKSREFQAKGLISILFIVQTISAIFPKNKVNIKIFTNNIHHISYKDILNPLNATVLGAITTVPLEYKNIDLWGLDLDLKHLERPVLANDAINAMITHNSNDKILALRNDKLFTRTFESMPFKYELELQNIIKDNGVYLVTGGLGGIGVELATYLSKTAKVKLALTGRSEFPDRNKWDKLVKSGGNIADRIRRIQEIESNGAEVMLVKADVADKSSMESCVNQVQAKFGPVNGVLHCAGVAGGNIIPTLEPNLIYDTMNSKVFGTLILDELLQQGNNNLDFMVLCSSISSITGTFGQMSYTASNSFLDAYTHYKNAQGKRNVICFNWDIWQEVGMATKAMKELNREDDIRVEPGDLLEHPLFVGQANMEQKRVYLSHLSPQLHWMIDEHRILNQPVLPGATYVEMLGFIASNEFATKQFKIHNLNLYTPFVVDENTEKSLYTVLKEESGVYHFSIRQKYNSEKDGLCAKGTLEALGLEKRDTVNIAQILQRCNAQTIDNAKNELNKDTSFLELGKRWTCLKSIHLGEEEGVAAIEMPDEYSDDFTDYNYHPAMLDIAFNYFAAWKIGQNEYLPFSFKNMKVYKAIPQKLYSYVKQNGNLQGLKETISFNVNLVDEFGELIISIEEYILKKVYSDTVKGGGGIGKLYDQKREDSKDALLEEGIKSEEGTKIFDTILSNYLLTGSSDYSQVVVSNNDLRAILESGEDTDAYSYFKSNKSDNDQPFTGRPELSELYEAPINDRQEKLCEFFQNYLRIDKVGVNDNFFELGISSLDVAEIKIGIEEGFQIELPVAVIFENPNIKALANFIAQELGEDEKKEEIIDRTDQVNEGRKLLQRRLLTSD
ncbi:Malonyl CoA-acyl carrier protein transacylase [Fulvivirga imtechensis AK7]|uniref:Malonyl CoA-acyl carrier protein transacylase n=1 Tax=Fulvivirga imtechensis AK7 TaxID=1237149 RepID=L8JU28_9BACT|nr:type I polyketide synthase [Fulvivirga imtechensis]ELR72270.1 Malonyl CoA-acyl carrier protein transacylase [Fulvivirga imtechensis AK7]